MKIRKGFVSNSSSSSFIIAFPHRPKSVEDLKEMMFGKQEWHFTDIYGGESDTPTLPIAEAVLAKIKGKRSAGKKRIFESLFHGWFDSYMFPEMFPGYYSPSEKTRKLSWQNEADREEIDRIHEEAEKINKDRANAIAEGFMKGHEECFLAVMEFSDNDGEAILEHSGIFGRVDHIRTSYH